MSAYVQSKSAILEFRAALCTFMVEARQALAAMEMEARRALEYITHDQAQAWQAEARRSREKVAQCNLAIHNARTFKRIGEYIPSCVDEKKELETAERRLQTAQRKIEAVRHWGRVCEQAVREFQARLAQFISMLDGDLPKGVAALERILTSLDRYLVVQSPSAAREAALAAAEQERSMRVFTDKHPSDDMADRAEAPMSVESAAAGPPEDDGGGRAQQVDADAEEVVPEGPR